MDNQLAFIQVNRLPLGDTLPIARAYSLLCDMDESRGPQDYYFDHEYLAYALPAVYHLEKCLSGPVPTDKLVLELFGFLDANHGDYREMCESFYYMDELPFAEHYKRYLTLRRCRFFPTLLEKKQNN